MSTFEDFVVWAGGVRKAALHLNTSPARVCRLKNNQQRITAEIAEDVERVSHGLFKKERVLWPEPKEGEAA